MKNALIIASMASMLDNFNRSNIDILLSMGYTITLAANFSAEEDSSPKEQIERFEREMSEKGCRIVQIDFTRKIAHVKKQYHSFRQVCELTKTNFQLVHCHSPICAALTRLAFHKKRKEGTKVIYTAHGFHFYKGAPLINWLFFFPVEWICSWWTDVLITINKADYHYAKKYMRPKKTEYIPGVGVDTKKFAGCNITKAEKRKEFNIPDDKFVLLSVGELQSRKNQRIVIEAIHELKDKDIYYLLVGRGELKEEYEALIKHYSLNDNVKLLGFRRDIDELCKMADCFVHPSVREGLGIAPLEAMASGLPLIASNVNGIKDYAENGISGDCVNPTSVTEMSKAIRHMKQDKKFRIECGKNNINIVKRFDIINSCEIMEKIYSFGGVTDLEKMIIRRRVRNRLSLAETDFIIISVGEINSNKNHKVIVEAIEQLGVPQIKYLICGHGDKESYLQNIIEKEKLQKQIFLLGYQNSVREYLYAADIFAFPSKREGLGLAAIEAMAAGLPILTSNSGGINDFSKNEISGYKCYWKDTKGFAKAIWKLYNDNDMRIKMGLHNRYYARKFDEECVLSKMKIIYERTL